jgi:BirA family biotin operon repressor/biotin-[acetyl-CoA-carboxylase] ligase
LGGVLIETVAVGERRLVVVGVGLNIEPLPALREARELASGYACVRELDPRASAPAVLHRVALPLVRALQQFEREGFAGFAAAYARRDLLRGQPVFVQGGRSDEVLVEGVGEAVSAHGALRVRDAAGALHEITSGEASVRLAAAPGGSDAPQASPSATAAPSA